MQIAVLNALALMRWQGVRILQDFNSRDFAWLLIGALLVLSIFWVISRRRRRWL